MSSSRGAGSNVKRQGQPFQKGTCFSAIIFLSGNICYLKLYLYGYLITFMGQQTLTLINFEQFYSFHHANGAK
jgi:hypothetical protein